MSQSSYAPETLPDHLDVVIGGARVVRLNLLDENDEAEDLSGATNPKVDIAESAGATPIISKVPTVEPGGSKGVLEFTLSAIDTALLEVGTYVAQAEVEIGGETYLTDNFYVNAKGKVVS